MSRGYCVESVFFFLSFAAFIAVTSASVLSFSELTREDCGFLDLVARWLIKLLRVFSVDASKLQLLSVFYCHRVDYLVVSSLRLEEFSRVGSCRVSCGVSVTEDLQKSPIYVVNSLDCAWQRMKIHNDKFSCLD